MKMKKLLTYCSFFVGMGMVTLGVAPGESQAADRKLIPGSECKQYFMHAGAATYHLNGAVGNDDNDSLFLICPLVRDNTGNTNGLKKVIITYQDSHPRGHVKCYVNSRDHNGASLHSVSAVSPGWQGTQKPTKSAFKLSGPKRSKKVTSYYFASCILPGKTNIGESQIISISAEEY